MTEYDFSPAAQAAHQAKLRSIAHWTQNIPGHQHLANPFVPSESGKSDFFLSQRQKSRSKKKKGRGRSRGRRGHASDRDDDSSDDGSDYSGPDRPPTPPASAPAYGGFGAPAPPAFYVSPYGYGAGGYYQQPTTAPAAQYVPMLVNGRWVYQPVSQQQPASASVIPQSSYYSSNSQSNSHSKPHRRRSRSRPRLATHRRNSHSVPAFPSPPLSPYNNPTYAYGYATGYLYPTWSQSMQQGMMSGSGGMSADTSPQSMYSAPLPGPAPAPAPVHSGLPPGYVMSPPLATAGSPAGGYFGQPSYASPTHVVYGGANQMVVSPGGATSPYQVSIQSPGGTQNGSASIYSGMSGYVGGQPVVIVSDAPRKSRKSGGSSRRSLFGRLTGGM